MVGM